MTLSRDNRNTALALGAMGLAYTVAVVAQLSEAYIDFGDGNYLYIASRLLDGVVLYRDILSPQPPMHVCVGAALLWVGEFLGSPLYTVRVFSLLLHLGTMLIVARLAWRLSTSRVAAVCAAGLYLLAPIGFWWTIGFQSEPFEMAFLLASTLFFLDFKPRSMIVAGLLAAGGPLCNMTAVPFVLFNILYLLIRRPRLLLWYLAPILGIWGVVAATFEIATGAFFENVFFNQVGTFPKNEILQQNSSGPQTLTQYVIMKLMSQGAKVLMLDGPWIVWGIAGLFMLPKDDERLDRTYVIWLAIAGLLSIVFVTKGATMDYIFTLGEPILCATGGLVWAALFVRPRRGVIVALTLVGALWFVGIGAWTLTGINLLRAEEDETVQAHKSAFMVITDTLRGRQYELTDDVVQEVKRLIERHSQPGEAIIAHPHMAFIADRPLVEEYSEIFIWNIKRAVELVVDKKPGLGVAKLESMAAELRARRVPIIFLDMNQTGRHEIILEALRENYEIVPAVWPNEQQWGIRFETEDDPARRWGEVFEGYEQVMGFRSLNTPFLVLKPRN